MSETKYYYQPARETYNAWKGKEVVCGSNTEDGLFNKEGKGTVCGYKDRWLILGFNTEYEGCVKEFTDKVFLDDTAKDYKSYRFLNINKVQKEIITVCTVTESTYSIEHGLHTQSKIYATEERAMEDFNRYKARIEKMMKEKGYEMVDILDVLLSSLHVNDTEISKDKVVAELSTKFPKGLFCGIQKNYGNDYCVAIMDGNNVDEYGVPKEIGLSYSVTCLSTCYLSK